MARRGDVLTKICTGQNKFGLTVAAELYVMGQNQSWLAEQCKVSKQYISQIINGKRKPSPEVTEKIAKLINHDVAELRRLVLQKAS